MRGLAGGLSAVVGLAALSIVVLAPPALASGGTITTAAGTGVAGYSGDGGPAASAQLSTPAGVAVDGQGNVYVADDGDNVVRKILPSGTITTVAGTGVAGFTGNGGPATSATLNGPTDVVLDAAGNLYIADFGNHVVREVLTNGTIRTAAGNGTAGYSGDGGNATNAKLTSPGGLDVDTAGNVYIADYGNGTVRELTTNGKISTIAGTGVAGYSGDGGAATSAQLYRPGDVVTDGSTVYIADAGNARVRAISPGGTITTVAGNGTAANTGDGGLATAASLTFPTGLALDSAGNLFIADFSASVIREVDTSGTITTVAGTGTAGYTGDGGVATSAELSGPVRVNLDAAGDLYISDWTNHVMRQVSSLGTAATAPDAPTAVTATAGDTTADVTWTAPASDGGSAITGYTVTPNDGTADLTPIPVGPGTTTTTVTGLTNATTYTFTVTATNTAGTSAPSTPSAPVTPTAPVASGSAPSAPAPPADPVTPADPTAGTDTPAPATSTPPASTPPASTPPASAPPKSTPQHRTDNAPPATTHDAPPSPSAPSAPSAPGGPSAEPVSTQPTVSVPVPVAAAPVGHPRRHHHAVAPLPGHLLARDFGPRPTSTASAVTRPVTHPAPRTHHTGGPHIDWHAVSTAVVMASKKTAVPAGLLLLIGLFLMTQNRLDRRDPKLALAPVYADPGVSFVPAMS